MASGQTLTYEVVKGTKNLGEMTIERTRSGNVTEYNINSDVTYRILLAVKIRFTQYEKFIDGVLNWGKSKSTLAGANQKTAKITRDGSGYVCDLNGTNYPVSDPIRYSITMIYFNEPKDNQKVFSQQFARYLTFKKIGDHKYLLESPDGNNTYAYKNGICQEVKVSRDFATFYFKVQPSSLNQLVTTGKN